MTALSAATLTSLDPSLPVPTYDRAAVTTGIVHFGVGGFHRAHQAMFLDRLMDAGKALDWGICGVGVLPADEKMAGIMADQDHLYTLVLKHPDGTYEPRVVGSIVDYLFAPADPEAVLEKMADPATRIVSLTVTEGGYHVHPVTGELDTRDPKLQQDLAGESAPVTTFGFVTEALRRRRERGVPAFTVMSCDNIAGNGDVAHKMITAYAREREQRTGGDLADWLEAEVPFPNSMVDRITPVTTDADRAAVTERFGVEDAWPVVSEPFVQWVLEDRFASGRPPLEEVGVQVVDDVHPYEMMKLRLLNASHQALCYLGYLSGLRYAHEVCSDQLFADFLLAYMDEEATPTLQPVPGVDLDAYKPGLVERFANPEVRDTLARLCADSSNRIPTWLLPVVRDDLAAGRSVRHSALVVAAWARYAEGVDEQGEAIEVVDADAEGRTAAAKAQLEGDDLAFLRDEDLFGDLAEQEAFTTPYREALASLHEKGARATLEEHMAAGRG
ncbi:mannitol dehydrogenase family protein [Pseudokineococcus basanitobsidens]|uniref:Mannitol-1-phosphate 5-dehydrogenase n=1 Tax=Pseudokineococcus basanitobsidens TaxID=1926649 RepID=A0ABU8RLD7_9ACTN